MPEYVRALIVVLGLSVPAWYLAQQINGVIFTAREVSSLRACWLIVVVAEFLAGSFLGFSIVVAAVCIFARVAKLPVVPTYLLLLLAAPIQYPLKI
jgi:hypothetical protein